MKQVCGLILMGGLNTRMGGEKKALLQYKGKCFYEHVKDVLQEAGVEKIYASVERHWDMELGMEQIVDKYEKIGPLGGIVTMLEKSAEADEGVLVLPCDLPRISAKLIGALLQKFDETGLPVVLMSEGWPNPLAAVYTRACLPTLKAQIAEENYRATHWIHLVKHAEVILDPAEKYMISNINSREDYEALTEGRK